MHHCNKRLTTIVPSAKFLVCHLLATFEGKVRQVTRRQAIRRAPCFSILPGASRSRALIVERVDAGLAAARARESNSGAGHAGMNRAPLANPNKAVAAGATMRAGIHHRSLSLFKATILDGNFASVRTYYRQSGPQLRAIES